jgi:hypothetical protein
VVGDDCSSMVMVKRARVMPAKGHASCNFIAYN